jgi:hypothetical protein
VFGVNGGGLVVVLVDCGQGNCAVGREDGIPGGTEGKNNALKSYDDENDMCSVLEPIFLGTRLGGTEISILLGRESAFHRARSVALPDRMKIAYATTVPTLSSGRFSLGPGSRSASSISATITTCPNDTYQHSFDFVLQKTVEVMGG